MSRRLTQSLAVAAIAMWIGCGSDAEPDPCDNLESGTTCTWLGIKGEYGFNGDGLHRSETRLDQVQDVLFLPDGTAWFSDFNSFLVRRVLTDDTVQTMVGVTDPIFPGDGPFGGIPAGGAPGEEWMLNHPTNLLMTPDETVFLVGWHNHKLLEVDPDTGFVTVIGGRGAGFAGDGGPVSGALFIQPNDATIDEDGNYYVLDQQNQRIRKIDTDGIIDTIAGTGERADAGDGGPAIDASFLWQFGSNPNPSGDLVYHDNKLYISGTETDRIRVIDLETGIIDAFAGTGVEGDSGDGGPAIDAQLSGPRDLEIGPDGDLYFADTDNHRVRAVDLDTGEIRAVVGTGERGLDEEERLPALETTLFRPFGVAFDLEGNLFVMDTLNNRVVKVAR